MDTLLRIEEEKAQGIKPTTSLLPGVCSTAVLQPLLSGFLNFQRIEIFYAKQSLEAH